jgi:hypothetical protein
MFYALSRFRYTRLMVVLLIGALVAMGTYAAAASNTFTGAPNVGGGNQVVSGFTITDQIFDLNDTDPDQLDQLAFGTDTEADEVWVTLTGTVSGTSAGIACTATDATFLVWTCDLTGDSTTATDLIDYSVFAADRAE